MKGMMLAVFMMWSLHTPVKADEFLSILVGGVQAGFVKFQLHGAPLYQLELNSFTPGDWYFRGVLDRLRLPLPKLLLWWQNISAIPSGKITIQRGAVGRGNHFYKAFHWVGNESREVPGAASIVNYSSPGFVTLVEALDGRSLICKSNVDISVYDPLLYWEPVVLTPDFLINGKVYLHNETIERQWSTLLKVGEHGRVIYGPFFGEFDLTPFIVTAFYQSTGRLKSYRVSIGALPAITFNRVTLDEKRKQENTDQSDVAVKANDEVQFRSRDMTPKGTDSAYSTGSGLGGWLSTSGGSSWQSQNIGHVQALDVYLDVLMKGGKLNVIQPSVSSFLP